MVIQNKYHKKKYTVSQSEWDAMGPNAKKVFTVLQEDKKEQTVKNTIKPVKQTNKPNNES